MEPWVYIIHLKKRKDRYIQFKTAWKEAGLSKDKLHWFPAFEGSKVVLSGFKIHAKSTRKRQGICGCYFSHLKAIERAIDKNNFPLLILEDDAIPAKEMKDLKTLFTDTPTDANLLYFGALPVKDRKRDKNYCTRKNGWVSPLPKGTQLYGGHAYGIKTKVAAEELVEFLRKNRMTFDSALVKYQKQDPSKVAVFCPFKFYQSEGYSDIEGMDRTER